LPKVFAIGEALIDFIPKEKGIKLSKVTAFEKLLGGAPANVVSAVAKLGGESAFIGKIGIDAFGEFILSSLQEIGVDTSYISRTEQAKTMLAFVSLQKDGERDFMFYRNPSADMLLHEDEIKKEWFQKGDVLHFCSVSLIEAPIKYAHKKAITAIKEQGGTVSFDPNVRLPLWENSEDCRKTIIEFIPLSNILKISEEELPFITGIKDKKRAIQTLFTGEVEVILYTKGAKGAELYTKDFNLEVSGIKVNAIDTTGAGDAFMGGFLYKIFSEKMGITNLTQEKAFEAVAFANKVAALSTTRKGAVKSFPSSRSRWLLPAHIK
jgi:fructokinase